MKRFVILLFAFFLSLIAIYSQIPQTISWQGILQDSEGNNLNGNFNITLKLYDVATGGTNLWTEVHNDLLVEDGLANIALGEITALNLPFDTPYWLEIVIGENEPLPRIKLSSVPYSLYSAKSSNVFQNDSLVFKDSLGITRLVINPNEGSLKMMNNDTIWYSLQVKSPLETLIWNPDGTWTELIGEGNTITYDNNMNVMNSNFSETKIGGDGEKYTSYTSNSYVRDENGNVKSEYERKQEADVHGTIITTKNKTYNSDGSYNEKTKTEKFSDMMGNITIEENKSYDSQGNLISSNSSNTTTELTLDPLAPNEEKTENRYSDGTLYRSSATGIQRYTQSNLTELEKKVQYFIKDNDENIIPQAEITEKETAYPGSYGKETTTKSWDWNNNEYRTETREINGRKDYERYYKNGLSQYEEVQQYFENLTQTVKYFKNNEGTLLFREIDKVDLENNNLSKEVKEPGVTGSSTKIIQDPFGIEFVGTILKTNGNQVVTGSTDVIGNSLVRSDQTIEGNSIVEGNQNVGGDLNVGGTKNFRIDHPEDPENKYLIHAAIESNEVLNMYSGNVTTDNSGNAIVKLPQYFELINTDYRYQLTVIGDFVQAIVSKKIKNNTFEIKTDKPNTEVSWQVSAKRNDKYMREHPFDPVRNK